MVRGCAAFLAAAFLLAAVGCDTGSGGDSGWADMTEYNVGETGPAGGIIFYDKGERTEGWRYLEASLVDQDPAEWGPSPQFVGVTERRVGIGRFNTDEFIGTVGTGTLYAAELCVSYELNGFNDWFLPSLDELLWLFDGEALVGGFAVGSCWSSSEDSANAAFAVDYTNGSSGSMSKNMTPLNVRAVRRF
jgi:hypothetical protein